MLGGQIGIAKDCLAWTESADRWREYLVGIRDVRVSIEISVCLPLGTVLFTAFPHE